jgi:hypothetical protein
MLVVLKLDRSGPRILVCILQANGMTSLTAYMLLCRTTKVVTTFGQFPVVAPHRHKHQLRIASTTCVTHVDRVMNGMAQQFQIEELIRIILTWIASVFREESPAPQVRFHLETVGRNVDHC